MVDCFYGFVDLHDRQNVLLRRDLSCAEAFWREEWDQLKVFYKLPPPRYPPPDIDWQVGFLFWTEIGARAANRALAKPIQGKDKTMGVPEIRVEELKKRLDAGENLFLLDVRDEFEYEISNIGGQLIPLPELARRVNELDTHQTIVTVCKMGPRGAKAVQMLKKAGFTDVLNMTGGIHAWSDRVDHSVRKY